MTLFHTEKCCRLVSAHEAYTRCPSARLEALFNAMRLNLYLASCSSVHRLPANPPSIIDSLFALQFVTNFIENKAKLLRAHCN